MSIKSLTGLRAAAIVLLVGGFESFVAMGAQSGGPSQERCARELFYTVNEKAVLELAGVKSVDELSKAQRDAYRKLNEYTGLCPLKPEWTQKLEELVAEGLPAKPSSPQFVNPSKK